ncbi:MAG: class I SAM-dependent methyltransferase [Bacteroidota bacterium]
MGNYYHTKESVEEYIRKAEGHDGRQIISRLKEYLPAGSTLLEIGSGPGTDWKILKEYYNVFGSDNSLEFLKYLQASIPHGVFLELDARSLETSLRFDGIYSNKVLHHLEDEVLEVSIKGQFEILNHDGIVCHTFWKGENSEIYNDLFVNYHTDEGIRVLFEQHFEPLLIKFYKEFEKADSILYIGKKRRLR